MVLRMCLTAAAISVSVAASMSPAMAWGKCEGRAVECYEKVKTPDVYTDVARPVVVRPGWREVVETPPVIARRTDRVVVTPGQWHAQHSPAVYGTYRKRVLVQPAHVRYHVTPSTRHVVHDTVVVRRGGYKWQHQRGPFGKEKLCKIKVSPVVKTVAREVVRPGARVPYAVPAVYRHVERSVVLQPARTKHFYQPPVYDLVERPVVVRPAMQHVVQHPPVTKVVHDRVLVRKGGYSWRRTSH